MNIATALKVLFPNARQPFDFLVQDDGDGPYLAQWNLPDPQPTEGELQAAWDTWEAGQPARDASALEKSEAQPAAKQWFIGQQAALDFVRLTPTAQATAIDSMTLVQLKTVVKFLAVAVSMIVKRELLD
jgi:hypothetical protein